MRIEDLMSLSDGQVRCATRFFFLPLEDLEISWFVT